MNEQRTQHEQTESDWTFCRENLVAVSRTFSKPIEMLPGDLEVAVTCGYLLCRLADTIEDHPTLPLAQRDELYARFLAVLEDGAAPDTVMRGFAELEGDSPEFELGRNLDKVMRVYNGLPEAMRDACTPWVAEMTRGMAIYSHRRPGADGVTALITPSDLERYCFFVAGTVGHMLTDLFHAALPDLEPERQRILRRHAESFALGLQLVNILKDVTDDLERDWCFVPRSNLRDEGIGPRDLTDPAHRAAAHRAVAPIFDRARIVLDEAFQYTLALPPTAREIRLFCLLPLWMAVRTLVVAKHNDAQFITGEKVKISRDEVASIINDCVVHCQDDDALKAQYAALAR